MTNATNSAKGNLRALAHLMGQLAKTLCMFQCLTALVVAQKPGPAGAPAAQASQSSQSPAATGGQGLQGLAYSPAEWPYLTLPDVTGAAPTFREGRAVVCYRVAKANSATQPLILEPLGTDEIIGSGFYRPCGDGGLGETDKEGQRRCKQKPALSTHHWSPCSELKDLKDPLLMNQILVVGVDISDLGEIGVNVDQLKLLNINVTNQQGSPLNPSPIRPSFPATSAGGGGSGQGGSVGAPTGTSGKGYWWNYVGTQIPQGAYPTRWKENKEYHQGDVVTDSSGVRFYMANRDFPSGPKPTDPFPSEPRVERVMDGNVIWQEMNGPEVGVPSSLWKPATNYSKGAVVCGLRDPKDATIGPRALEEVMRTARNSAESPYLVAELMPHPSLFAQISSNSSQLVIGEVQSGDKICKDQKLSSGEVLHPHYYFAIRGGKSGSVPDDPFSITLIPRVIYLSWPYQLPGDVIPTFNVNLVYTPPVPGAPWQGNTFYPAGSVVTSSVNKGHYYTALTGGFSASEPEEPSFPVSSPPTFNDGTLVWIDSGTSAPTVPSAPGAGTTQNSGGPSAGGGQGAGAQQGAGGASAGKAQLWFKNTHYLLGDVIINPENGHYYTVVSSTGGISGQRPSGPSASADPFPQTPAEPTALIDGEVQWLETNATAPNKWVAKSYSVDDKMFDPTNKRSYVMIGSTAISGISRSGPNAPFPAPPVANTRQRDKDIYWMYSPQTSAAQDWQPNHTYYLGNAVLDGSNHVYVMIGTATGKSGTADPVGQVGNGQPITVSDGDLLWSDMGTTAPLPVLESWAANHSFSIGQVVPSANGHYYQVIRFIAGTSGTETPSFPILRASTVIEPRKTILDPGPAGLAWLDLGVIRPLGLQLGEPLRWQSQTYYLPGSVIFMSEIGGGRYYSALHGGQSGNVSPFQNLRTPLPITWQDSGTTAPASVANGQPADQTVSLINLTLPQSHSLSYFNLAAGVVVDFARPPLFGFVPASSITLPSSLVAVPGPAPMGTSLAIDPSTGCTINSAVVTGTTNTHDAYYCPSRLKNGPLPADPVLALTIYFPPVDAETPLRFKWRYLRRDAIPGFSLGLSLANPTSNFYVGGSNELFVRNVQIVYGIAFHNISTNLASGTQQPVWGGVGSAPTVATVSGFQKGAFVGATFNLSGFVQSLFGGGAKAP